MTAKVNKRLSPDGVLSKDGVGDGSFGFGDRGGSSSRAAPSQSGTSVVSGVIGMGFAAQNAAASEAGHHQGADAPDGDQRAPEAIIEPHLPVGSEHVDSEASASIAFWSGTDIESAETSADGDVHTVVVDDSVWSDVIIDVDEGTFPFVEPNDTVEPPSAVEIARAMKNDAIRSARESAWVVSEPSDEEVDLGVNVDDAVLPASQANSVSSGVSDTGSVPIMDGLTGPGAVLDVVTGDDGLLDTVLGEDGLLDDTLDTVLGDDGVVDTVLDVATGDDGLLGGVTGSGGLLSGLLSGVGSNTAGIGQDDGLAEAVTASVEAEVGDSIGGTEADWEGIENPETNSVAPDASDDQKEQEDDGFLDTLLAADDDTGILTGLIGDEDVFGIDVAPMVEDEADDLFMGLGGTDDLGGSLVERGLLDDDSSFDAEVDDFLNQIIGSSVDGDVLAGGQNTFEVLIEDNTSDEVDELVEEAPDLLDDTVIDDAISTLFGAGDGDSGGGLLGGLFGSNEDDNG